MRNRIGVPGKERVNSRIHHQIRSSDTLGPFTEVKQRREYVSISSKDFIIQELPHEY